MTSTEPGEPERLGLFGGTFDPVHEGHVALARLAWETCALDRVLFVPAFRSPFKLGADSAPGDLRAKMCEIATAGLEWAEVATWELERGGTSYSWETAEHFAEGGAELFWILGADQWAKIDRWARSDHLAELVTFVAFTRSGEIPAPREGYRLEVVEGEHPASSTAIRKALRGGEEPPYLHAGVRELIREEGLYQNSADD